MYTVLSVTFHRVLIFLSKQNLKWFFTIQGFFSSKKSICFINRVPIQCISSIFLLWRLWFINVGSIRFKLQSYLTRRSSISSYIVNKLYSSLSLMNHQMSPICPIMSSMHPFVYF